MVLEENFNFTSPNPNTEIVLETILAYQLLDSLRVFSGEGTILSLLGDDVVSKFGMCVKCSFSSIRLERFDENCFIWILMYFRKLSLFHRPMRRMVVSLMLASFMDIAPPDLMECVPISLGSKPRSISVMERTVLWRKLILSLLVI